MLNRLHVYLLAFFLIVVGFGLFFYKSFILGFPVVPRTETQLWTLEANLTFEARGKPVKVTMFIPKNSTRYSILDENFVSRGFGLATDKDDAFHNRQAAWSIRKATGLQSLYYRCVIRRIDRKETKKRLKIPDLTDPGFDGPDLMASESLIDDIRRLSADDEGLVAELWKRIDDPNPDENADLLLGKNPSMLKKIDLASRILNKSGIAARVVQGVRLKGHNRFMPLVHWLEVFDEETRTWLSYDPREGSWGIPDDYLTWWRGTESLGHAKGADRLQVRLAVNMNYEQEVRSALETGKVVNPLFIDFSLFSLPLHTQAVYRVLLLVPLGAFLVVLFRNVIGLKTFGTFMPVLIALAFRETRLGWGVTLFILVVALGLSVRLYFSHLKLLMVPRMASILIVVVILMALLSILSTRLGLESGISIALFPMVILTMTIERMSIVWEELGPGEAFKQGLGSLVIAMFAYFLISNDHVQHIIFEFPELLFALLGCTLLLGRYTGYRLLELRRFRALTRIGS